MSKNVEFMSDDKWITGKECDRYYYYLEDLFFSIDDVMRLNPAEINLHVDNYSPKQQAITLTRVSREMSGEKFFIRAFITSLLGLMPCQYKVKVRNLLHWDMYYSPKDPEYLSTPRICDHRPTAKTFARMDTTT